MKAILFTRVSTLKQDEKSQEDVLRKQAIHDGFKDNDIIPIGNKESAVKLADEEREGLKELYSTIENGGVDCIYIWELSRLSRKPATLYRVRDYLFDNKIQLKCTTPNFTLLNEDRTQFDPTSNIIFSLFGALAEQEVIEKKERFARGKAKKAEEGKYAGGAIPFGYMVDYDRDKLIVINEEEASIVREIFDMYESGISIKNIAQEYYERGNLRLTISLVHNILINESYTGKSLKQPNSSYFRSYPIIITQQQFDKCREIAKTNNTNASKTKTIYFGEKLIKCPTCGCNMIGSGSKNHYKCYDAYYINKRLNGYSNEDKCTNKSTIAINVLDSLLWHYTQQAEHVYMFEYHKQDVDKLNKEKDILLDKLGGVATIKSSIQAKLERLQEAYVDGLSKDRYTTKKEEIKAEERQLNNKIIEYNNQLNRINQRLKEDNEFGKYLNPDGTYKGDYLTSEYFNFMTIIDDVERQKLVRKHIREVSIEGVNYEFNFASGIKPTKAKKITIHYVYLDEPEVLLFVPFDGKGGVTVYQYKDSYLDLTNPIKFEYLNRFYDKTKAKYMMKKKAI